MTMLDSKSDCGVVAYGQYGQPNHGPEVGRGIGIVRSALLFVLDERVWVRQSTTTARR